MTLPLEATASSKKWIEQRFLMIGAGKSGKSSWWSWGDKTFFFDFEGGLKHLSVKKLPCRSWDDFIEVCRELYIAFKDGKFPYDTGVIDTYDRMVDMASEQVVELAKKRYAKAVDKGLEINVIGDVPEGVGWDMRTQLVSNAVNKLADLPWALVLISHVNTREITDGQRKINKDTISVGGQTGTKIIHWADHTLHVKASMNGSEIVRVIRTKPMDVLEAGSRGNVVPDGFRMENGEKERESYLRFRQLFD